MYNYFYIKKLPCKILRIIDLPGLLAFSETKGKVDKRKNVAIEYIKNSHSFILCFREIAVPSGGKAMSLAF